LLLIPRAARASFVPYLDRLPVLREGENDLTRIAPGRPLAAGDPISIVGRVTDRRGRPLRVLVEIWAANSWGRYTHEDDPADKPLDPNFLGIGRTITDDDGRYTFRTVRPGSYLARADIGRWRPAHVHFSIRGGTARLVTQMYFVGDPYLDGDPLVHLLGAARDRHVARPIPGDPSDEATHYRFDIVVGGPNATWFDDHP
jgi:protocatechuate 3,4-dioxygenase beta subunit